MTLTNLSQAKRLKALNFDVPTLHSFDAHTMKEWSGTEDEPYPVDHNEVWREMYSRPTLSEVLDWARERHGIHGWVSSYLSIGGLIQYQWEVNNGKAKFPVKGPAGSDHNLTLEALVDHLLEIIEKL